MDPEKMQQMFNYISAVKQDMMDHNSELQMAMQHKFNGVNQMQANAVGLQMRNFEAPKKKVAAPNIQSKFAVPSQAAVLLKR